MYLVDTNVWLERFLEQEKAEEVRDFLDRTSSCASQTFLSTPSASC